MKKSQRLRLAYLQNMDAATLTAADRAELDTLAALAVTNPEASNDLDDSSLTPAAFFSRLTSAFKDKDALGAENARLKTELAALKKNGASQADANDAAVAAANVAKTNAERAKITAEEATCNAEKNLASANAQLGAVVRFLGLKPDALPKTAAEITVALNGRIDLRAGDRLGEMGFPCSQLPAYKGSDQLLGSAGAVDVLTEYAKISDPVEAARFYSQNIAPRITDS